MDGGIYNITDGMGRDAAAEGGARPDGDRKGTPLGTCTHARPAKVPKGEYIHLLPPPKKPFPPPKSRRAARKTHPPRVNALYRPGCVPNENGGGYGQRPSGIGGLVLCTGNELLPASARGGVGSPRLRAVGSCLCVCVCVCVCEYNICMAAVGWLRGGSCGGERGEGARARGPQGRGDPLAHTHTTLRWLPSYVRYYSCMHTS